MTVTTPRPTLTALPARSAADVMRDAIATVPSWPSAAVPERLRDSIAHTDTATIIGVLENGILLAHPAGFGPLFLPALQLARTILGEDAL